MGQAQVFENLGRAWASLCSVDTAYGFTSGVRRYTQIHTGMQHMKHVQKVGLLFQTSPKIQTTFHLRKKLMPSVRHRRHIRSASVAYKAVAYLKNARTTTAFKACVKESGEELRGMPM